MTKIALILIIFFLNGCSSIPFEESKVEVLTLNKEISTKDINNKEFNNYLLSNGYKVNDLPIKAWGVKELLLGQYFFNYDLKTAQNSIEWIRMNEQIALLEPSSSLGIEIGRGSSNEELSDNIFGGGFNFSFERPSKKLIRYEIAFNETQLAILNHEKKIWKYRTRLLQRIVSYVEKQDLIKITKEQLKLKHSILQMIQKRVILGIASQVDYDRKALELKSINQKLIMLQFQQTMLKKEIATNIGLSIEKFNLIPIDAKNIKALFVLATGEFLNGKSIKNIQQKATTNSRELRLLLATYAVAESKLKYEIAKQNPDFNFSPAYTYDLGNYIWNIGIDGIIGDKNKNELFINRAKKIRSTEASKVLAYQLQIINDVEILVDGFQHSLQIKEKNEKLRDTKNKLKKQLYKRFENGILDRLELELEVIKFYEIEKNYHKAFFEVIKKGLDAELIVQEPIFTEKII
jgi:outer membrane protein TolC